MPAGPKCVRSSLFLRYPGRRRAPKQDRFVRHCFLGSGLIRVDARRLTTVAISLHEAHHRVKNERFVMRLDAFGPEGTSK